MSNKNKNKKVTTAEKPVKKVTQPVKVKEVTNEIKKEIIITPKKDEVTAPVINKETPVIKTELPPKQIIANVDITPLEHVLPFIKDCMVIKTQEDLKTFGLAEKSLKEHMGIGSLLSHAKAHNYIPKIYSALQANGWNVPQSWIPFIKMLREALIIAKLFTPPHIDIMIDRIIYLIDNMPVK